MLRADPVREEAEVDMGKVILTATQLLSPPTLPCFSRGRKVRRVIRGGKGKAGRAGDEQLLVSGEGKARKVDWAWDPLGMGVNATQAAAKCSPWAVISRLSST